MSTPTNKPTRTSTTMNFLSVPPVLRSSSRLSGVRSSRSPTGGAVSLSPAAFQMSRTRASVSNPSRSPFTMSSARSSISVPASRSSNLSAQRANSLDELSLAFGANCNSPLSKQTRGSIHASPSPTFGCPRVNASVALTSRYIKMNVNEKCDPARTPYFAKITMLQRVYAVEVDHWGRRGICEYVGVDGLAGDKVRGEKANVCSATMGRKLDDSELNAEYDAFDAQVGDTPEAPAVVEAMQLFADASGTAFKSQKGTRAFVNEAAAKGNLDVMTGLQQMFARLGFFALVESLSRRTLKLCQAQFDNKNPKTLDCMHLLGTALQKQGLAADAEEYFRSAASGRTAAYVQLTESEQGVTMRRAIESMIALSVCYVEQGKLRDAEKEIRRANHEALIFGSDDILSLRASSELGRILTRQGRLYDADALLTPLTDRFTSICGASHPDTLQCCSYRAALLVEQDKQDEAVVLAKQTLAMAQESLGDRHVDTLRLMRFVAILTDSAELFQQLITIWSKMYGAEHMMHYAAVTDMGTLHARNGNLATARACFEKAYAGFQKLFGPYHRATTLVCSKLGDTYTEEPVPRDADAEWYIRAVLSSVESNFGVNHVEARKAGNNVAVNCFRRFRCEESLDIFKKYVVTWAQEVSTLTATMDDVLCYLALHNYSQLLSHLNTSDKTVEEIRLTVWKGWARILGDEHPNTLMAMLHYGVCLRDLRQMSDAERVLRSAWEARKKVFGEDHCETLEAEFHLAAALKISLYYAQSKVLHDHAYQGRLKLLGDYHTDTSSSEYYLCLWHMAKHEIDEALIMQKRCIAGYERSYGPQHYWTMNSINTLGNVYAQMDDHKSGVAAVECFHQAWDGLEKMFGPVHQESLRPLITLASLKRSMLLLEDSIELWTLAVSRSQELYGPNAPKTISAVCRLTECYSASFMPEKAEEYYDWIVRGWEAIQQLPADEIDPRDVRSLNMIRDWAATARNDARTSSIAKKAASLVANNALRTVAGVVNYFRT